MKKPRSCACLNIPYQLFTVLLYPFYLSASGGDDSLFVIRQPAPVVSGAGYYVLREKVMVEVNSKQPGAISIAEMFRVRILTATGFDVQANR